MLNGSQRKLRVAVQLASTADEAVDNDDMNNNSEPTAPRPHPVTPPLTPYQSLRVFDHQTLNIKIRRGKFVRQRFDHVSHAVDDVLNLQVCLLLDELILQRRNCSLLFFDGQRDASDAICLFKMLIAELNLRLEQLEAGISKISLVYLKSDYKQQTPCEEADEVATVPEYVTGHQRVCHFFSTLDLLKWLLNVYRLARTVTTVYESLEFSFRVKTSAEVVFDTKLSVFDLYFRKFNAASRKKLYAYVNSTEQRTEAFQHSEMTLVLKDYLKEEADVCKLLLCNIPAKMKGSETNAFLLTIAIRLYEQFAKEKGNHGCRRSLLTHVDLALSMSTARVQNPPSLTLPMPRPISFSIPFNEPNPKKNRLSLKSYSNDDLNKLRNWYAKLDEGFEHATQLMEKFYERKYGSKILQICEEIRRMSRTNDLLSYSKLETLQNDEDEVDVEDDEELRAIYKECKDSLQNMNNELEASNFVENLRIYFCTKHFAYSQHMLSLQIKELKRCKQQFNEALDGEISILSGLLYEEERSN